MPDVFAVAGYREFMRACARAPRDTRRGVAAAFAGVGEHVRADAASRFATIDARSAAGFRSKALTRGVLVFQSLRKTTGQHPEYGALQMRTLLAARAANTDNTERALEHVVDLLADRFERNP